MKNDEERYELTPKAIIANVLENFKILAEETELITNAILDGLELYIRRLNTEGCPALIYNHGWEFHVVELKKENKIK